MEPPWAHPALRAGPQTSCWHCQSCGTVPSGTKIHQQKAELKITPNASSGCFSLASQYHSSLIRCHLSHLAFSDQALLSWVTQWAKPGRSEKMERWNCEKGLLKNTSGVCLAQENLLTLLEPVMQGFKEKEHTTGIIFHEISDVKIRRNKNNVCLTFWLL